MKIEFEGPSSGTVDWIVAIIGILILVFLACEYSERYEIIELKKAQIECVKK